MNENVAIIQKAYADFLKGDIPAVLAIVGEEMRFEIPGPAAMPMARVFRGRTGMAEFFHVLAGQLEFTEFNPREYIAQGDRVVVLGNYAGRVQPTGKPFAMDWVMVWRLRDGKAVEFREYNDTLAWAEAYNAAGRTAAA